MDYASRYYRLKKPTKLNQFYRHWSYRVVVGFSGAGRPRELEIRTTVMVEINDAEDKPLQPLEELKIYRSVTFNDTDVLATQAHELFHTRDINKQLAMRIIQKLQRIDFSEL